MLHAVPLPCARSVYAPIASLSNRIYYVLITISLTTALSRFARDKLRRWQPKGAGLRYVDPLQVNPYVMTVGMLHAGGPC